MPDEVRFDEIGYWSEVKLDIIREYAAAYSRILSAQSRLSHVYIDGFAGAGVHRRKETGELVPGSPLNALNVDPAFEEYHFIDLNEQKVAYLQELSSQREDVFVYPGDCNAVLLEEVFPRVRFEEYRRGLCLLDPYGLHLNWEVIKTAGQMRSIEIFLNFPICDMNRNVLWCRSEGVSESQVQRMNAFWGDDSWRKAAYRESAQLSMFGPPETEKTGNKVVAEAFRKRLKEVAGFEHVAEPVPMKNTQNAIVYYLFFACHKPVAQRIVRDIFDKYRERAAR